MKSGAFTLEVPKFRGVHAYFDRIQVAPDVLSSLTNGFISPYGSIIRRAGADAWLTKDNAGDKYGDFPPSSLCPTFTSSVSAITFAVYGITRNDPITNSTNIALFHDAGLAGENVSGIDLFHTLTATVTMSEILPFADRFVAALGQVAYPDDNTGNLGARWRFPMVSPEDTTGGLVAHMIGIPVQNRTLTLTATLTGTLTGTYKYRISWMNEFGSEGNISAASEASITVTTKKVTVSILQTDAPKGITFFKLWRTLELGANPLSDFYFVAKVAIVAGGAGSVTYDDNTLDSALGLPNYFIDHFPPPAPFQRVVSHLGSLWAFYNGTYQSDYPNALLINHKGRIYKSFPGEPDLWNFDPTADTGDAVKLFAGDRGDVTGIISFRDRLLAFTRTTVYAIFGTTVDDIEVQKVSDVIGCIAPGSIIEAEGKVFWLGAKSVYMYDGASVTDIGWLYKPMIQSQTPARPNDEILWKVQVRYDADKRIIWWFMRHNDPDFLLGPGAAPVGQEVLALNLNTELPYGFSRLYYSYGDFTTFQGPDGNIYGMPERDTYPAPDKNFYRIYKFTGGSHYKDYLGASGTNVSQVATLQLQTSALGDREQNVEITAMALTAVINPYTTTITATGTVWSKSVTRETVTQNNVYNWTPDLNLGATRIQKDYNLQGAEFIVTVNADNDAQFELQKIALYGTYIEGGNDLERQDTR